MKIMKIQKLVSGSCEGHVALIYAKQSTASVFAFKHYDSAALCVGVGLLALAIV
jgi:hypothetical protein